MRWCGALAVVCACARPASVLVLLLVFCVCGVLVVFCVFGWVLWLELAVGDRWATGPATEQLFQHAAPARPRFRTPRPFVNDGVLDVETLPVMFDVRFDPHGAHHVAAHQLASRDRLAELASFTEFPREALAVKLT